MSPRADVRAFAQTFGEASRTPEVALNERGAIQQRTIDLSGTDDPTFTQAQPGPLKCQGYGLVYLRRGSNPGGMLEVTLGGTITSFGPGDTIRGYFDEIQIRRADGSARTGYARLAVLRTAWTDYTEAATIDQAVPVVLKGTFDSNGHPTSYAPITEDTDPTGANGNAPFDISGWKEIEVYVDGNTAAANATSWDMVPFVDPGYAGDWHEQGTERLSIPDSDTSGFRYRMFNLRVGGRGRMDFAVRNLLAAARTGVGIAVRGVR